MTAAAIQPDYPFSAFAQTESDLRTGYLSLESDRDRSQTSGDRQIVEDSARLLELFWVGALLNEAAANLDVSSGRDARTLPQNLDDYVRTMSGLEVKAVAEEAKKHLEPIRAQENRGVVLSLSAVVRAVRSILEACPIEVLEQHASEIHLEGWGHRCRIAYDGHRAFSLRADPAQKERVGLIGRSYASGALSIAEAAKLLDMHPVDAVALLEEHGFKRSLGEIALPEATRSEIFGRLRARRLRGGSVTTSESLARDVVASERIEGVDARRWIPREQPA